MRVTEQVLLAMKTQSARPMAMTASFLVMRTISFMAVAVATL
jgi:hypothetical protein